MIAKTIRTLTLFALAGLILSTAACGAAAPAPTGPVTSALTEAQAREMGENAFQAINSGDYAAWTRDWSDAMKAAIPAKDFQAWREQLVQTQGQYQSLLAIELQPGKDPRFIRWIYTLQFEKGKGHITFSLLQDGSKIDGVFSEAIQ